MASRKRTTVADLIAAEAIGAIDGSTVVALDGPDDPAEPTTTTANPAASHPGATEHECAIPGCRHGASHPAVSQPDRQLKLAAECGAVIRTTARALATAGGTITDGHGHTFAVAPRRTYVRRAK